MTHASVTIILHEHRALSAMLRAILLLLGEHRRRGTLPDFGALRAMLFYVDEFPEKLHHPKESRLLFPKLRGHSAHSDGVLDRLCRDHERGEHAILGLEHALLGFELMGETDQREPRRATFETAMTLYVRFYLEHMHIEEAQVLPLAEAMLGAGDWAELDDAFLANRDPLTGFDAVAAYQPLFMTILGALPRSCSCAHAPMARCRRGHRRLDHARPTRLREAMGAREKSSTHRGIEHEQLHIREVDRAGF